MTGGKEVLDAMGPQEALAVLRELTKDPVIREKAQEIALTLLCDVDVGSVADQVLFELECLSVEEVWDYSGSTSHGYVEPSEYALQLFEEALEPFVAHMRRCHELSLTTHAKLHCMGVLKGIHRFHIEAENEFKELAIDAAGENTIRVFEDWKKSSRSRKDIAEVKCFVETLHSKETH